MTTVTWYAFEDPKTKREYYYEPLSDKTTWTLPITSGTPVKSNTGTPPAIPASPATPMGIASDSFATSPSFKMEEAKNRTKTERNGSESITRGFGKRDVVLTIGTILLLNTLTLGILVKVMNSSSIADLSPMTDQKSVPCDNDRMETVDVGSEVIDEIMIHPGINEQNESEDAAAEEKYKEDNYYEAEVEEEYEDSEGEELMNESIQHHVKEESCEDNAEEDAVLSEGAPSSADQEDEVTEKVSPDGSKSFVEKDYEEKEATVHDSSTSKRLTRAKIFSIITPIVGFGAARVVIALITKLVMILSPPAAPVVVVQASGPMAIIKTFFDRILGRPSPILKDPTLMEKLTDFFVRFSKIK